MLHPLVKRGIKRTLRAAGIEIARAREPAMPRVSYASLTEMEGGPETPHLGGNVKEGDPYTFCPTVWAYVIERFCVRSVLDLGSGLGHAAEYFFRTGLRTVAIDGLAANVQNAFYPTICHDLTNGPVRTAVDLVHCQEVVEHIAEEHLGNLLQTFRCGRLILMTHAVPGQTGYHHVNERSSAYWVELIEKCGYKLMRTDTDRIRSLANQDGATYMAATGLLFHRS
jgi:SAM-dependent methyltransferase